MEIPLADALSHVTPLPMEDDGIQLPIIAVNLVTVNIPYSSNELDSICEETRKDSTLTILTHYINMGWPCERKMLPQELHPYWNFRKDLSAYLWSHGSYQLEQVNECLLLELVVYPLVR